MSKSACLLGAMLSACLLAVVQPSGAEPSESSMTDAELLVCEALNQGMYGLERECDELLRQALRLDPDCDAARWHSGYVKTPSGWKHCDAVSETPTEQRKREAYEDRRAKSIDTPAGQLTLANWCRDQGMPLQERAHLNRVIQLETNHPEARQRLGFVQVNGAWKQRRDFWQGVQETQETIAAIDQWRPRLQSLAEVFRDGNPRQCEVARDRLMQLATIEAIPALEMALAADSEAAALAVVESLGGMPQRDSSLALARLAVLSPWAQVRENAARQLRDRPQDHYVPVLLAELSTPIQSRIEAGLVNGRIQYRHSFMRETQDAQKLTVLDATLDRRPTLVQTSNPGGMVSQEEATNAIRSAQAVTAARAMNDVRTTAMTREQMRLQQNAMILDWNERIGLALSLATDQDLPPSPEAWWAWWDEQNEVTFEGDKTAEVQYRQDYRMYEDPVRVVVSGGDGGTSGGGGRRRCECFVAGTPVWTITGPKPIESVQVGDMLLSQHPETGELAYKPVLRTTIRDPERLIKVTLCTDDRETLEASGGHPLWVSGHGWVLFRHLQSGMVLHTVDGSVRISDVQEGSFQQTYNLIVADHQTYIVGRHRVLCHDNTDREPTDAIVPGLLQE